MFEYLLYPKTFKARENVSPLESPHGPFWIFLPFELSRHQNAVIGPTLFSFCILFPGHVLHVSPSFSLLPGPGGKIKCFSNAP